MVRGTRRRDKKMKKITVLAYATLLTSVAATQGFAHSTFVNENATAESTLVAALQVPHGCEGGLATTEVQVQLPEGFIAAKPQPKAGWELEIIKGDYQ
jgi:periplasmic copper chaperone A